MADRPPSPDSMNLTPAQRNVRVSLFRFYFDELPQDIQKLATKAFKLFCVNPYHPSLRWHKLKDNKKGSHYPYSFSVSINMQYRAIYFVGNSTNVWYWVGTHAAYNQFTGKS